MTEPNQPSSQPTGQLDDLPLSGSLLDDNEPVAAAAPVRRARRWSLGSALKAPWRTPKARAFSGVVCALLIAGGGAAAYLTLRPTPKPDYELDSLDLVFDFTLLEEEFNRLPVEERIALLSQLWERMQSMDTSQSVLLASFAGSITGQLRDQLERNVSRLMIDVTDKYAMEYQDVPSEQREEWLGDAFVRMVRLSEPFDPGLVNRTDEEILNRARRDAQRDRNALQNGDISAEAMGGIMSFAYRQGRNNGSLREQQRLAVFVRDLTRELRKPPGGGG